MMEPDDLVAEAAGAPGDAADDAGSWLVSALQKEPPEPHSEPQRSYWESYVGGSSSSDTLDEGGDPSPEPAASWLATYETSKEPPETVAGVDAAAAAAPAAADSSLIDGAGRLASHLASLPGRAASTGAMAIAGAGDAAFGAGKECEIPNFGGSSLGRFPLAGARAVSEFQPLAAVARLVGGDEGAPADGAWAVPSFLAGDFDDDDDGAARGARGAPAARAAPRRRPRARARGRPCRLRLKRRRGDGAACLVLVAPGAGGWARVPLHRVVGVRAADDAGAGPRASLFDDRGDRREAHELAVGAAATRDALVLALEALAARERARHGVHRRRFRAAAPSPERVAARARGAAAPADEPLARPPLSPSPSILDDASSSDDDDDDARSASARDGARRGLGVDAAGASFRVTLRGGDALDIDVAAARAARRRRRAGPRTSSSRARGAGRRAPPRWRRARRRARHGRAARRRRRRRRRRRGPRLGRGRARRRARAARSPCFAGRSARARGPPSSAAAPGVEPARGARRPGRLQRPLGQRPAAVGPMGDQLLGIGIPWVIRGDAPPELERQAHIARRPRLDRRVRDDARVQGPAAPLGGVQQEDTHPIDGSKVRIWSAVGARPPLAPAPDAAADPPPPGAIVTVMEYVGLRASRRSRTVRGGAAAVRNDLLKRKTREAVSTTSVFVRDDAALLTGCT
ncbi:hypothetical protein SO694_00029135 [Aureococcus anophagefferens]|uniref:Uncharacterized protein n=1 Tax=Aureococcus anophagefferens TaxID=44056 RepID=A0ABR1FW11_AURAN